MACVHATLAQLTSLHRRKVSEPERERASGRTQFTVTTAVVALVGVNEAWKSPGTSGTIWP